MSGLGLPNPRNAYVISDRKRVEKDTCVGSVGSKTKGHSGSRTSQGLEQCMGEPFLPFLPLPKVFWTHIGWTHLHPATTRLAVLCSAKASHISHSKRMVPWNMKLPKPTTNMLNQILSDRRLPAPAPARLEPGEPGTAHNALPTGYVKSAQKVRSRSCALWPG